MVSNIIRFLKKEIFENKYILLFCINLTNKYYRNGYMFVIRIKFIIFYIIHG